VCRRSNGSLDEKQGLKNRTEGRREVRKEGYAGVNRRGGKQRGERRTWRGMMGMEDRRMRTGAQKEVGGE